MSSKRGDLQSAFSGNADVRSRILSKIVPKGKLSKFFCFEAFNSGVNCRRAFGWWTPCKWPSFRTPR